MKTILILSFCLLISGQAAAADDSAMTMGYGVTTCAQFAQSYQVTIDVEQNYFNWAQGFMSGLNAALGVAKADTRDLNALPVHDQMMLIRDYCSEHPLDEVQTAVFILYISLPTVPAPKA